MKAPRALTQGDLIIVLSPAKKIERELVESARKALVSKGFRVEVSSYCTGSHHSFSGSDIQRAEDFQNALDREDVRAVLCARGGYGSARILEDLDWTGFKRNPKWICGFSDITVFHHATHSIGVQSIHATMPLNFAQNSKESIDTLVDSLTGRMQNIETMPYKRNIEGTVEGELIGGNLSIIYSLLSTEYCYDFSEKILFIEDLCEQYYHIDRILISMEMKGVFKEIKGLIVGGMTDLKSGFDMGMDLYDIVLEKASKYNIPVCFHFPCGHIDDNRAMIIGAKVSLSISKSSVELSYI